MQRNIVITGASGGIGSAAARRFFAAGDRVLLVGHRNAAALEALVREAAEAGAEATCVTADLSTLSGVEKVAETARSLGSTDVLVNNAGIAKDVLFQASEDAFYQEILHTNLSGAIRLTKALLPDMIARRSGTIINVSSVYGSVGCSMEVEYAATKGGLEAFTRSLAKEVAPSGISVNAVAPGLIDTKMNDSYTEEEVQALVDAIPVGRMGRPEEVADVIYYLSVAPKYLTGQVLRIDGGWL